MGRVFLHPHTPGSYPWWSDRRLQLDCTWRRKKKLGAQAIKRVAAGAHLPTSWLFWACEMPRRQSLLPGLQFPPPVEAPGTRFYTWVEWGAPYGRTVVRARPNEHSQWTGPPSNADLVSLPKGNTRWNKRVPNPLDPESYALPMRHTGWRVWRNRIRGGTYTRLEGIDYADRTYGSFSLSDIWWREVKQHARFSRITVQKDNRKFEESKDHDENSKAMFGIFLAKMSRHSSHFRTIWCILRKGFH